MWTPPGRRLGMPLDPSRLARYARKALTAARIPASFRPGTGCDTRRSPRPPWPGAGHVRAGKGRHAQDSTTERYLHAARTSYPDAAELAEARLFTSTAKGVSTGTKTTRRRPAKTTKGPVLQGLSDSGGTLSTTSCDRVPDRGSASFAGHLALGTVKVGRGAAMQLDARAEADGTAAPDWARECRC